MTNRNYPTLIDVRMPEHSVMRAGGVYVEDAGPKHVWMRFHREVYRHGALVVVDLSGPKGRVTLSVQAHEVRYPGPMLARDVYLLADHTRDAYGEPGHPASRPAGVAAGDLTAPCGRLLPGRAVQPGQRSGSRRVQGRHERTCKTPT